LDEEVIDQHEVVYPSAVCGSETEEVLFSRREGIRDNQKQPPEAP
jgi:hypothetical protein